MAHTSPDSLPPHLSERIRLLRAGEPFARRDFILYWMRTAVRGHENPALDAALWVGRQVGKPVFVYHALSERYPYASDRHHTFILEGARDVQAELARRRIGYAFHLERKGHRGPHLSSLARQAALVLTEDMPVPFLHQWAQAVTGQVDTPVWLVDTACVVPMCLVGRRHERAFAFRDATAALREERLRRPWPEQPDPETPLVPELPFAPLDLATADIPSLVAECNIDHSIGPVPHTRGGSVAGYARWEAFLHHGLARYAEGRNDAALDGVSRMSAYLHYGHVSPLRVARTAAASRTEGAEKWLDELLVWRELAYTFCLHTEDPGTVASIPGWALESLRRHQQDTRPALYCWETLARGVTGDRLWDAAQASLLRHGELHNNLRMTWGKALVNWTRSPEEALALALDLNHRYALDGRDPASYGGLLWILGQFDRPFPTDSPIWGKVRARSTREHLKRLDIKVYESKVRRPLRPDIPRVGVIGAGLSGLILARTLKEAGYPVKVFDKGRTPAGRLSTRRTEAGGFDHGAQYFTARDERFRRYVDSWVQLGHVAEWKGRMGTAAEGRLSPEPEQRSTVRYVGVPGMSALAEHLARSCDVHSGVVVRAVEREGAGWRLVAERGEVLGVFDAVVAAVPAPQAVPLLAGAPALAERAARANIEPCWAVMVTLEAPVPLEFDGLFIRSGGLSWAARDSSKPGRRPGERWVLHGSPAWTREHLEEPPEEVAPRLLAEFHQATGVELVAREAVAHRWRYALPSPPLEEGCLFDARLGLGACGDWCAGPRVEGAFLSGMALAGRLWTLPASTALPPAAGSAARG